MENYENIAFELHEQWRKTRLKEDGFFEPRWKIIKDKTFIEELEEGSFLTYIRKNDIGEYEIDIANAYYSQLSEDWKEENKAAAKVVYNIVNEGKNLSIEEIGNIIHDAWLERNAWAKNAELGLPFSKLSKEEQDKDLIQYDIALKMSQAERVDRRVYHLDEIAKILKEDKVQGKNTSYKFNKVVFHSEFDNLETCYVKVSGMTKKQYFKLLDEVKLESEREMQKADKREEDIYLGLV